jgi:dsRNA-specific ribonuclease
MDLFEEYLNKKDTSRWVKIALTDASYNSYRCRGVRANNPRFIELHTPLNDNLDLALLGDAIIKFIYSDFLLDKVELLTEEKKKYESDEVFVEKVGRHYNLIPYIDFDIDDEKMPKNYDYYCTLGWNKNSHKYIATAVEAMIGAIYKETNDLDAIRELLLSWMNY